MIKRKFSSLHKQNLKTVPNCHEKSVLDILDWKF